MFGREFDSRRFHLMIKTGEATEACKKGACSILYREG